MLCAKPWVWLGLLVALALSGCAGVPTQVDGLTDQQKLEKWQEHKTQLSAIQSWNLRGKMGVKTGPKGGSATLKWRYSATEQYIELYGPLGGGRVIIDVDSEGAVLRDTKGVVIRGHTASEVLYRRLGWQVPFDHLADWARGLAGEDATDIVIDAEGRLKHLVQDNWLVEYQGYRQVEGAISGLMLPTKIAVSAIPGTMEVYSDRGEYLGDQLNVKVILKKWWEIDVDPS
jgi:outer membrane lipoprotein LolB